MKMLVLARIVEWVSQYLYVAFSPLDIWDAILLPSVFQNKMNPPFAIVLCNT